MSSNSLSYVGAGGSRALGYRSRRAGHHPEEWAAAGLWPLRPRRPRRVAEDTGECDIITGPEAGVGGTPGTEVVRFSDRRSVDARGEARG